MLTSTLETRLELRKPLQEGVLREDTYIYTNDAKYDAQQKNGNVSTVRKHMNRTP